MIKSKFLPSVGFEVGVSVFAEFSPKHHKAMLQISLIM